MSDALASQPCAAVDIYRDGHCGTGAAQCDTATLPQFQFGVAVEGRDKGLKSAAVEVPRSPFLYCGPRLYFF